MPVGLSSMRRPTRPLGSVRPHESTSGSVSVSLAEKQLIASVAAELRESKDLTKTATATASNPSAAEKETLSEGIIVSSMAVPPGQLRHSGSPKSNTKRSTPPSSSSSPKGRGSKVSPASSSSGGKSDPRQKAEDERKVKESKAYKEKEKALKEMEKDVKEHKDREKSAKQKTSALEKLVDELQDQVRKQEEIITQHKSGEESKNKYKELYEAEVLAHKQTSHNLAQTEAILASKEKAFEEFRIRCEKEVAEVRAAMEKALNDLAAEKDKEIEIRDAKLSNLKKQMVKQFDGNSWERQQQLDELTKELGKLQDDNEQLRALLNGSSRGGKKGAHVAQNGLRNGPCQNCQVLQQRFDKREKIVKEKDKTISELKLMVSALEKQVKEKEKLLEDWNKAKGRSIIFTS